MSKIKESYNKWAGTYDDVENKTRDLDKIATNEMLLNIDFENVLELGCGTGKNTEWLASKAKKVTAVDFSIEMISKAQDKIKAANVTFLQHDITKNWSLGNDHDLITCNLILEHIQDLNFIFFEAYKSLTKDGKFFISELHPFKQYTGSKARFENINETIVLDCFTHHASEYFNAAIENNFTCTAFKEWFDDEDKNGIPRLISFIFQKK